MKKVRDNLNPTRDTKPPSIQAIFLRFLELAELREENIPRGQGEVVLFNLGRFSKVIGDWESINHIPNIESFQGFAKFLHYQAGDSYSEGVDDSDYMSPDAVQIMTVHQTKGREWPAVFMPALLRNRFPSPVKADPVWHLIPRDAIKNSERYHGSKDDERRLFYVAMTRSKKFLHMTWAPIKVKNNLYAKGSEFWDEVQAPKKWVSICKPDYGSRKRLKPEPRTTTDNIRLSFSHLKQLDQCRYQYKLGVLYGFNKPADMALEYGHWLHRVLAEVHDRARWGNRVREEEVPSLVERCRQPRHITGDKLTQTEKAICKRVNKYIKDNRQSLGNIEFVEQDIEVHLQGVSIKGRIGSGTAH